MAALLLAAVGFTGCANLGGGAGNFTTVIVDAGHGGHDQGAKARSGMPEKMLTLDTARRLAAILRTKGFRVIETRSSDVFIPLGQRTATSNAASNAIFVSIHYNWSPRRTASGIEIYYYNPRAKRLAGNVLKQTLTAYPTKNRGVKYYSRYYVLHRNKKPSILCELGFVSNSSENSYLQNAAYRQKLAEKVAAGIMAEKRMAL